jgi:uncharacterized membrane protein YhaH (DUF805 family)
MGFGEAIKTCRSKLFVFEGRARRSEFWYFYLFLALISFAINIVLGIVALALFLPALSTVDASGTVSEDVAAGSVVAFFVVYGLIVLVSLVLTAMMLGVWVRRLHDTGQSGHWLWLNLIGLGIVPLIMAVMDSTPGPNQYGEDPKVGERVPPAYGQPALGYAQPGTAPAGYAEPAAPPVATALDEAPNSTPGEDPFRRD